MVKQFGGVYMLFVRIAQRTDGVMKNKPVFRLNYGSSTYFCVKSILHPIIFNNTSLITFTLCRWTYHFFSI